MIRPHCGDLKKCSGFNTDNRLCTEMVAKWFLLQYFHSNKNYIFNCTNFMCLWRYKHVAHTIKIRITAFAEMSLMIFPGDIIMICEYLFFCGNYYATNVLNLEHLFKSSTRKVQNCSEHSRKEQAPDYPMDISAS